MPRGGRRNGTAGKAYPNRTDLTTTQPVRTAPGQPYGAAGAQAAAQQAVPLPGSAPTPTPQSAPPAPPDPGMLHAPTARPAEPVTAGLPIGAGPGPEAMGAAAQPGNQVLANLYRAYQLAPTPGIAALIAQAEKLNGPV